MESRGSLRGDRAGWRPGTRGLGPGEGLSRPGGLGPGGGRRGGLDPQGTGRTFVRSDGWTDERTDGRKIHPSVL